MTESIKLTAKSFQIWEHDIEYFWNEGNRLIFKEIFDEDNIKLDQRANQILENQEIVNDIIKIVKRKPQSDEDKTIIKVLREI